MNGILDSPVKEALSRGSTRLEEKEVEVQSVHISMME